MDRLILAWTTVADKESAEALARQSIERKLAVCIQIEGPVQSIYSWQGKVETEEEWRLMIKTTEKRAKELKDWIMSAHPYETPEWIAIPTQDVGTDYLRWAHACLDE